MKLFIRTLSILQAEVNLLVPRTRDVATIHYECKLSSSHRRLYEGDNTTNTLTALYCYNNEPRNVLYCKDKHDRILSIVCNPEQL
jgi:hypothetical protein